MTARPAHPLGRHIRVIPEFLRHLAGAAACRRLGVRAAAEMPPEVTAAQRLVLSFGHTSPGSALGRRDHCCAVPAAVTRITGQRIGRSVEVSYGCA